MIHNLHICRPCGYYLGQIRRAGARRWQTVTGRCQSAESAMSRATARMQHMKRARVLFIDDCGYYEPHIVLEAKR